jgi:hypothetical protein
MESGWPFFLVSKTIASVLGKSNVSRMLNGYDLIVALRKNIEALDLG